MMMLEIKVGGASVSWGIMEVEGWSRQKPYGEVLDEIAQAGYSGTELGLYDYYPTEPLLIISHQRLNIVIKRRTEFLVW